MAELYRIACTLFFALGCITSLNDVIVPRLKALYGLPYAAVMLVPGAFFGAYLCMALPAARLVGRVGHLRSAVSGLLVIAAGCLLFVPAAMCGAFPAFLVAIFVLAAGITIVQVMVNPMVAMLGEASSTGSRLSFSQAFYSLGTTVAPYAGASLILGGAAAAAPGRRIATVYAGIALATLALAGIVWRRRGLLGAPPRTSIDLRRSFGLLRQPLFGFGVASAFAYVGAEITIGSLTVNYLMQPSVMGLGSLAAGRHLPWYWGGAMAGRLVGGQLLRHLRSWRVLEAAAGMALVLLLLAATLRGAASGWALLALGLCNSVMYPTIFSLACRDLGERAAEGSGVIVLASVGGAIVPVLAGLVADHGGLRTALVVPGLCYAAVLAFGLHVGRREVR